MNPYFVGMVYEGIVIIISTILIILIFFNYIKNRNFLSLLLFLIFLNYSLAIIFSWLSKILILFSNINYLVDEYSPDPLTPLSWILLRITGFRVSFMFITTGTLLSNTFKEKVFEMQTNKTKNIFILCYGCFTALYSIIVYLKGDILLDVFAFTFVFLLTLIIYLPFMFHAFKSYKAIKDLTYKKAFLSLTLMSLCQILTFFNFLIDRILILLGDFGFTIFYFLAWLCVIIAIFSAYFGYLKPTLHIK